MFFFDRDIALLFNRQLQEGWEKLCAPERDERGAARSLVMEAALIAGFSKVLAEKLLRLCGADTEAVLAAEQPHQETAE